MRRSDDRTRLLELEARLREARATLADACTAYMRAVVESERLEAKVREMRGRVKRRGGEG